MQHIGAAQLSELLGAATAEDMQIVLLHAAVKLYGVDRGVTISMACAADALDAARALARQRLAARAVSNLLTDRELEIAGLLYLSNKGISNRLGIGVRTVRTHIESAMRKSGAQTRTELALCITGVMQRVGGMADG